MFLPLPIQPIGAIRFMEWVRAALRWKRLVPPMRTTQRPSRAKRGQWGNTVYGTGSRGRKMETFSATDANDSARNFQLAIDRFQLQLPIFRGKLGVSASFDPLTEARYRTYREDIKY